MATLLELETTGELVRLDPELGPREMEDRRIFLLPRAREQIERDIAVLESTWQVEISPIEQLDALVHRFCTGQPLSINTQFRCLNHLGEGVWELKTGDLRLFGWFPLRDCFICCDCISADLVKVSDLYYGLCRQVAWYRDKLNLDDPKFLSGTDPNVVVSNWC